MLAGVPTADALLYHALAKAAPHGIGCPKKVDDSRYVDTNQQATVRGNTDSGAVFPLSRERDASMHTHAA
jgi:hypothetical protein